MNAEAETRTVRLQERNFINPDVGKPLRDLPRHAQENSVRCCPHFPHSLYEVHEAHCEQADTYLNHAMHCETMCPSAETDLFNSPDVSHA